MALPETGSAPIFQGMAKNTRPPDLPHDPPPVPPVDEPAAHRRRAAGAAERNKGPILEVLKRVLPETGLVLEIGSGTGQHAAHFAPRLPGLVWQPTDPDPEMRASIDAWAQEAGTGFVAGDTPENKRASNLRPALDLDVTGAVWPIEQEAGTGAARTGKQQVTAVFSANRIHIAPWDCCEGLLAGAGRILQPTRGGEDRSSDRETTRGGDGQRSDRETTSGEEGPQTSRGPDRGKTSAGLLILYGPFKIGGRHTAPSNESFDRSLRAQDASWGVRDLDAVAKAAAAHGLALTESVAMPANNLTVVFRKRG